LRGWFDLRRSGITGSASAQALDEPCARAYLAAMARRLLLTLLALLGLAAQLSPAQARLGAGAASEVGVVVAVNTEAGRAVRAGAIPLPQAHVRRESRAGSWQAAYAAPRPAAVRPGIDRARE